MQLIFYLFEDVDQMNPNAILIGLAPSMFHYEKLTEAFNLLSQGAELIAVNKSRYFKRQDGLTMGAGELTIRWHRYRFTRKIKINC